jgi:hypothetical protein
MKSMDIIKSKLQNNILTYETVLGDIVELEFSFNEPASEKEICEFEYKMNIKLPDQFRAFLKYTNGATLFKGTGYDEGGYIIPPVGEIMSVTNKIRSFGYNLDKNWIVFAELYGYTDFLVFDLNNICTKQRKIILDGDSGYQSDKWTYIYGDFQSWLYRIITCNGDMYWRWY